MIALVKKYASSGLNDLPFPDMYDSETGKMDTFKNRAVVGGHFAPVCRLLSLGAPATDSSVSLFLLSSSFLMSRRGTLAAAVVVVATMVESMAETTAARQNLPAQLYP